MLLSNFSDFIVSSNISITVLKQFHVYCRIKQVTSVNFKNQDLSCKRKKYKYKNQSEVIPVC